MAIEAHTSTETKQACCQLMDVDYHSIDPHTNCILESGYMTIQENKKLHLTLIFRGEERGNMGGKSTSMISIQWFLKFASEKQADYLLITKQSVRLTPTCLLKLYRRAMYEPNVVSVASHQRILIPSNFYRSNLHALFYAVCQQYHIESHHGSQFGDCMLFDVPGSLCNVSKREKKHRLSTYKKPDIDMSSWSDEDDERKGHTDIRESPIKPPTIPHIIGHESATDVMDAFEKVSDSFVVLSSVGLESSLPIRLLAYTSSLLSTSSSSQCFAVNTKVEEASAVVLVIAETTVEAAMSRQKQVFLDDFFGCVWLLLTVGTLNPLRSTKTNRLPSLQGTIAVAKAVLQLYLHCSGVTIGLVMMTETLGQAVETYYQSTVIGNYYVIAYLLLYLMFPALIVNKRRGLMLDNAWIVLLDVFIVLNAVLAFLCIQSLFHIILVTTSTLVSKIILAMVTSIVIFFPLLRACIANDYTSALILLQSWLPHITFLPTRFVLVPIHAIFSDINPSQHVVNPAWALCLLNVTLAGLSRMLRVVTWTDMTLLSVLLEVFIYSTFAIVIITTTMRGNRWNGNQCCRRYKYQKKKSEPEQAMLDLRRRFGDNREDIHRVMASIRSIMGDDDNHNDNINKPQTTAKNARTNDNDMMMI